MTCQTRCACGCARAFGREEGVSSLLYPALTPSARVARLGPHWAKFATRLSALTIE